ncbi:MAG: TATA-box-binding protein [Methanophagales archaeon]|nr:TATA-box-binding protein [Methanophagales archaeon]
MVNIRTVNLVVTTDLKHTLDLEKITTTLSHVEYNPEQFPGLVMRIKEPKTSALLFTSGKVVCTGAKDMVNVKKSIHKIISSLKKVDVKITIEPVLKIQNLVGAGELGFDLNLTELAMKLRNVEYEPEQFPGAILRIAEPKLTLLLFKNGKKIVCTGTKSEEEMEECVKRLVKDLKTTKKGGKQGR